MAKAKSGLTAVRQTWEDWLIPPITFTPGAGSFTSSIRDGKGQAAAHIGISNDNVFTLAVFQAWQSAGPFIQTQKVTATLDPASGLFTCDVLIPINRRFLKFVVTGTLGNNFEAGAYLQPRADSGSSAASGGGSAGAAAVPNRASFNTGQASVVTADGAHAVQLSASSVPVPDGFSVFFTFRKANSGTNIYVGNSQVAAQTHGSAKIMNAQNAGLRLYVTDVSNIWIDADLANDGVDWIVEK